MPLIMEDSSTQLKSDLEILNKMYADIPNTRCVRGDCGDWCCSRLPGCEDEQGRFISLPMIYSIEYMNIKKYILSTRTATEVEYLAEFGNKMKMCSFRQRSAGICGVYPVRPFSCQVNGRKVPPHFWGREVTEEAAKGIVCKDCHPQEPKKEEEFIKRYTGIWDQLADLSFRNPLLKGRKQEIFKQMTGFENIYIFGWHEFCILDMKDEKWFEDNLKEFWAIYGNLF